MALDQQTDKPANADDKSGDSRAASAVISELNSPGSTNKDFNAAKVSGSDTAQPPAAKIDDNGITFGAGTASSEMPPGPSLGASSGDNPQGTSSDHVATRGIGRLTNSEDSAAAVGAPETQSNDLLKTAGEAQKLLDQANLEDKAKLSGDQSAKLKALETGILSGDFDATKTVLESMRPLAFSEHPLDLAEENRTTMNVLANDLKMAGISAQFDPKISWDEEGFHGSDPARHFDGPIGSLHLSDHHPANIDEWYNKSFTDVAMRTSRPVDGFAEQSVPKGFSTTPDFDTITYSQALKRLGEVAQKNLGVRKSEEATKISPR